MELWLGEKPMNKTFVSPFVGCVISALLLFVGVWQFATDALWQGGAFVALAIVWAIVAFRQVKKNKKIESS